MLIGLLACRTMFSLLVGACCHQILPVQIDGQDKF